VVKQSLRASVESYSIKKLEEFYGFTREMDLKQAGDTRALVERCLEIDALGTITDEDRKIVAAYNRDDCVSTLRLRDWLETLRAELVATGEDIPRPTPPKDEPSEKSTERDERIRALIARLTKDVPDDRAVRTPAQHGRWLLAHMLDFHRREDKVTWWEYFDLRDLEEEDWLDSDKVIAGLTFVKREAMARTRPTDRYSFPPQACHVKIDEDVHDGDGKFGKVVSIDRSAGSIVILKDGGRAEDHPPRLFAHGYVPNDTLMAALERIANSIADDGIETPGLYRAACSLLLREKPRLKGPRFAMKANEPSVDFAIRMGLHLDGTVLPIQGPPGSGKTFTGAHMICAMVKAGLRVGVTATSHAVIRNLLNKVLKQAKENGQTLRCGHRLSSASEPPGDIEEYISSSSNPTALNDVKRGAIQVLGGTQWLWAREDAIDVVDVLVVDEAGQMALPNVIIAASAANSVVLLGDPQQLDQPQKGSHPDGTDASALAHILDGHKVMPDDRGIFLAQTWRMAPSICAFCSEAFDEGKLTSREGLHVQRLSGAGSFDGAGLFRVHVDHVGNTNESAEEVEAVVRVVDILLAPGATWTNAKGEMLPMTAKDILVVAPYNLHVDALRDRLTPAFSVGTVDKFQGQKRPS
jgi:uncharacterized protein